SIQSLNEQYQRLTDGIAPMPDDRPGSGRLMKAFRLQNETRPIAAKILAAQKAHTIPRGMPGEVVEEALTAGVITEAEAVAMREARDAGLAAMEVDVFTPEQYFQEQQEEQAPADKKASLRKAG